VREKSIAPLRENRSERRPVTSDVRVLASNTTQTSFGQDEFTPSAAGIRLARSRVTTDDIATIIAHDRQVSLV
jgi:hypothetical protein